MGSGGEGNTVRGRLLGVLATIAVIAGLAAGAAAASPSNDDFAAAQTISAGGGWSGTNVEASKETGEPDHAGNPGGASVWYRWVAPSSGWATVETCDSDFDTLLAVYTGSSVSTLTEVTASDNACGTGSGTYFKAVEGTAYRFAVDGAGGATGIFRLGLTLAPSNDDFADAHLLPGDNGSIEGANGFASIEPGEPLHAGDPGGASVWYRWTAPADGTASFETCSSAFDTLLAVYTGSAVGSLAEVASNDDACGTGSRTTFLVTGGTVYSIAVDGFGGDTGAFVLRWSRFIAAPTNVSPPTVSGEAVDGGTLRADPGRWTGTPPINVGLQWEVCNQALTWCITHVNRTSDTWVISGDIGYRIRVVVTGSTTGGSTTVRSEATPAVRARTPSNMILPVVYGTPQPEETLSTDGGHWGGTQPINYAYRWQRCDAGMAGCADIPGATDKSYDAVAADLSARLRVVVIASNAGGQTEAVSLPTKPVANPPAPPRRNQAVACVVPRVGGKTVPAARKAIAKARCATGKVTRTFSKRIRSGRVVAQKPRAGTRLRRGSKVHLVVSRGRKR